MISNKGKEFVFLSESELNDIEFRCVSSDGAVGGHVLLYEKGDGIL